MYNVFKTSFLTEYKTLAGEFLLKITLCTRYNDTNNNTSELKDEFVVRLKCDECQFTITKREIKNYLEAYQYIYTITTENHYHLHYDLWKTVIDKIEVMTYEY